MLFRIKEMITFPVYIFCLLSANITAQNNLFNNDFYNIIFKTDTVVCSINESSNHKQYEIETTPKYTLNIKADFKMEFVLLIPNSGTSIFDHTPNTQYTFKVGTDTFHLMTIYYQKDKPNENTFFYKKFIVDENLTVNIYKGEANKVKYFQLLRYDNTALIINQIDFYFKIGQTTRGLGLYHIELKTPTFTLNYNQIPAENFINEWLVKGKQPANNGDLYLLNGELQNTNQDLVIQNDPENYAHANFYYSLPDTLDDGSRIQIGFAPGSHFFLDDPPYIIPVHLSIYQDMSAPIDFLTSKFWQILRIKGGREIESALVRLDRNKVWGFTSPKRYDDPIVLSETNYVTFCLTPTFWFGKFANKSGEIKITGDWGISNFQHLFLSQTNDVLPHYPSSIKIINDTTVIIEKEILSRLLPDYMGIGYHPDSLRFFVSPDKYNVVVLDEKSKVANKAAITKATVEFDLNNDDKNPPNMLMFQILSGDKITNILNSADENIIRFRMEDDNAIGTVELFYRSELGTDWIQLTYKIIGRDYAAELPQLSSGYYSLMIKAVDLSDNAISVVMEPAFQYNNTTSIEWNSNDEKPGLFILYPNYPNPFNPVTKFNYTIPEEARVKISIYNLMGELVEEIINQSLQPGSYEAVWDASNVTSGVYVYVLEAGSVVSSKYYHQSRKMIVLK